MSTNTWSLLSSSELSARAGDVTHWMDVARLGVRLAREAVGRGGRGECAVAFALSGRRRCAADRRRRSRCCAASWRTSRPTCPARDAVARPRRRHLRRRRRCARRDRAPGVALASGAAVTASAASTASTGAPPGGRPLRPCRAAVRGAGRRRAPDQLPPARPRAGNGLVAPRLHRPAARRVPEPRLRSRARLALRRGVDPGATPSSPLAWRDEGAQIVGGCCGVGAGAHRGRARRRSTGRQPAARAWRAAPALGRATSRGTRRPSRGSTSTAATCSRCRFPRSSSTPACSCRRRAATSLWKHLFRERIGAGSAASTSAAAAASSRSSSRCNGAERVHAVDIDRAPSRTRSPTPFATASPSGSRGEAVDLLPWEPDGALTTSSSRASTRCRSTRSSEPSATGRSTTGAATSSTTSSGCCRACSPTDGVAYVMQLSIIGQLETQRLLVRGRARGARGRLRVLPLRAGLHRSIASRSCASRSAPTLITSSSAARTSWSRTCSRCARRRRDRVGPEGCRDRARMVEERRRPLCAPADRPEARRRALQRDDRRQRARASTRRARRLPSSPGSRSSNASAYPCARRARSRAASAVGR